MPSTSSFPFLVNKVSSFHCDHEQHLFSIELVVDQSTGVDHEQGLAKKSGSPNDFSEIANSPPLMKTIPAHATLC
jgi:hypothetical protein